MVLLMKTLVRLSRRILNVLKNFKISMKIHIQKFQKLKHKFMNYNKLIKKGTQISHKEFMMLQLHKKKNELKIQKKFILRFQMIILKFQMSFKNRLNQNVRFEIILRKKKKQPIKKINQLIYAVIPQMETYQKLKNQKKNYKI